MPTNGQSNITEQQRNEFLQKWAANMIKYWQEKMMAASPPVFDTGALYNSLAERLTTGDNALIEHRFLEYGLYVAAAPETATVMATQDWMMRMVFSSFEGASGKKAVATE